MPRQNTGSYTQPANTTGGPAGTTISSVAYNTLISDLGSELTNSLDRRGRGPMLAALNAGGFQINGVAEGTLPGDAARIADITGLTGGLQTSAPILGTAGGTSDALTATFNPTITALTSGLKLLVRAAAANTTPTPTFAADGTPAAPIVKGLAAPLSIADISGAGHYLELLYDATFAAWILLNPALGSSGQFVGMIAPFASPTNPTIGNWLICFGQSVSRTTYAALFGSIGTLYGAGDGSTTFNVPNLQGFFLRALDQSGAIDPGRSVGSYQGDALQQHTHSFHDFGITTGISGSAYGKVYDGGQQQTSGVNGANITSETRPINKSFNFFIKA